MRFASEAGQRVVGKRIEVVATAADLIEAAAFADFYEAAPPALAVQLGLRTTAVGGATLLLAPKLPATIFNRAIGLGMSRPATKAALDAVIDAFRLVGQGELDYWIHANPFATPEGIPRWLEARGFRTPERRAWAKMVRGAAPLPEITTSLAVRRLQAGEESATAQVIASAFGMPPFLAPWIETIFTRPRWTGYAVLAGRKIVGGGALFVDGEDGWLGLGSVAAEFRSRGGQGALMALRIADAIAAGCTRIVTETGEAVANQPNHSLSNMYRCGFEKVCSRINYAPPRA